MNNVDENATRKAEVLKKSTEMTGSTSLMQWQDKCRTNSKLQWWRDAKFGMFVHWGVYSKLAGEWKGKILPPTHIGEWIMHIFQIPLSEYKTFARKMNPTEFNAKDWVRLMKKAGMKYIVFTAKHHEGFAMYHSKVCDYNIVDYTDENQRDILKELADACHKEGIKFCLYYSHMIDFHHPHASRNEFAHPHIENRDIDLYLEEKCKPQLEELLKNYGKVDMIWFDMPESITKEQAESIKDLIISIQQDCIIGGRLGQFLQEYMTLGDNEYPQNVIDLDWETPGTSNDTWGFKNYDHNWKTRGDILRLLTHIVARGGNYLLNLGPTAEGAIPEGFIKQLQKVGDWMSINHDAIYGTTINPLPYNPSWGEVTTKDNKLYLHIYDWSNKIKLFSIQNKIKSIYALQTGEQLNYTQDNNQKNKNYQLQINLPDKFIDPDVSVIVIECEGNVSTQEELTQKPDSNIVLSPYQGTIKNNIDKSSLFIDIQGQGTNWTNINDFCQWQVKVTEPGTFKCDMISRSKKYNKVWNGEWEGGHEFELIVDGKAYPFILEESSRFRVRDLYYYDYIASYISDVTFRNSGTYDIILKPRKLHNTTIDLKFCYLELKLTD